MVKPDPWISKLTVCSEIEAEGDGLGPDPPAGGGLWLREVLGEGEDEIAPKTAGEEAVEGTGTVDPGGIGEGDGFIEGLTEALAAGLREGFKEGIGEGDGEGGVVMAWPNTPDCFSAVSEATGKRIDLKNNPDPSKITAKSPERYKVGFGILIFFIYRQALLVWFFEKRRLRV